MKKIWPQEHVDVLRTIYPVLPMEDLLKILPYSKQKIKCAAARHKLTKKGKCYSWKYEHEQKLIELYPTTLIKDLQVLFDKTESQIGSAAFKLKLVKDPEFKYQQCLKSCYKPGSVPLNKGKKQSEYMSPQQIEKTKATRFKTGQKSITELYDGAITERADKSGTVHKYIRISKGVWVELQIVNWEKVNGPIPEGHCLWCLSEDRTNCDPSNWELITQKENLWRNSASNNLTDRYVANTVAWRNAELADEILQYPEIIDLKRKQLQLNRAIKQHGK